VKAIIVRTGLYNDEDISSKPQVLCDLGVPQAERKRERKYRNGGKNSKTADSR